jgi:16S rRNA (uracil1498-N3)-methyltransferase
MLRRRPERKIHHDALQTTVISYPMMRPLQLLALLFILIRPIHSFIPTSGNIICCKASLFAAKEIDANISGEDGLISQKKYTNLPRLYVGPLPTSIDAPKSKLSQDVRLPLDSDQAHYVTKVMRIDGKKKSLLRLFDGSSGEWLARINVEGSRNRITVHATCLEEYRTASPDDGPWLFFAPLQNKARIKWLLEKCTELGASRFVPIQTERTVGTTMHDMDKLALQLVEASEQCERLVLPTLSRHLSPNSTTSDDGEENDDSLASLQDLLDAWESQEGDDRQLLICRERSSSALPVLQHLMDPTNSAPVAFLVGPEGGWSVSEEKLLNDAAAQSKHVYSVSLGSNVLRAETAAMTAMAAYALRPNYPSSE